MVCGSVARDCAQPLLSAQRPVLWHLLQGPQNEPWGATWTVPLKEEGLLEGRKCRRAEDVAASQVGTAVELLRKTPERVSNVHQVEFAYCFLKPTFPFSLEAFFTVSRLVCSESSSERTGGQGRGSRLSRAAWPGIKGSWESRRYPATRTKRRPGYKLLALKFHGDTQSC